MYSTGQDYIMWNIHNFNVDNIKVWHIILPVVLCEVWNLVVDIAGGKEAEGVWEHGVEENIWT